MSLYHLHIAAEDTPAGFNTVHNTREGAELLLRAYVVKHLTKGDRQHPERTHFETIDMDDLLCVFEREVDDSTAFIDEVDVYDLETLEDAYKKLVP
jgi:hypothetical protein